MELHEIEALVDSLSEDVAAAREDRAAHDDQYRRRTLVRTTFAAIEGWSYALKQAALEHATQTPDLFSAAELACLREESYDLSERGEARVGRKILRTVPNTRFALRMFLRCEGVDDSHFNDRDSAEFWSAFQRANDVRNRIVHPKQAADLTISDEELELVEGVYWGTQVMPGAVVLVKVLLDEVQRRWGGRPPPRWLSEQRP